MPIILRIIQKLLGAPAGKHITKVLVFALILNLVFGVFFYFAEREVQSGLSVADSIWWAMVTMTTVGYGDFYAQTFIGRYLISYPCMVLGIGIIGYLVGLVAEEMLEYGSRKKKGQLEIKMKKHIIICNYPGETKILRLQEELNRSMCYSECEFVLISDKIDEIPVTLRDAKIRFVKGDPTQEEILNKANIKECAGVFVLAEDMSNPKSDAITFAIGTQIEMMERENDVPIKVVGEMVSQDNLKMMQRSKMDGIVSADGIMDVLIAQEFLFPGLHDVFHEVLSNATGSQFYIVENKFAGLTFVDIQKKAIDFEGNVQVVGISRGNTSIMNPDKKEKTASNDKLIALADSLSDYEQFEKAALA
jgi:voltage-gated potassium channel